MIPYAGIGSREAPVWALELAERLADRLRSNGYVLRSGHAEGMDSAFEAGAMDDAEVYLPWPSFGEDGIQARYIHEKPTGPSWHVAEAAHPNWPACSSVARRLHARNAHIILGADLLSPAAFVVCWFVKPGGTSLACTIAQSRGILVLNLANDEVRKRAERYAFAEVS